MSDNSQLTSGLQESLSRRPLPDVIAERITATIANGTLTPGDRLPSEPVLAKQLQVGRTSLREALRKLATLGVIEIVRGKGTFVCEPPPEDPTTQYVQWSLDQGFALSELLEVRIGLETTAAGLACTRATDDELGELDRLRAEHDKAHDSGLDALVRTDEALHEGIVRAAHNVVLAGMYLPLVPQMTEFRRRTLSLPRAQQRSDDHRYITDAIGRRDPEAARRAVAEHLWIFYQEVRAVAAPGEVTGTEVRSVATFV
ncbi:MULTISPECIES: FadR/GntR family transcriptional regulator [Prauserella]|uniref:FadR family transcriptional regulator n=1 Tax=Prauserella endophytica TaxID=1592324 RepID=A0ABY2S456_9PSEU|nr:MULTISPECIES: FadR/GntR family transcriptional regulator [Prauserella]TKG69725.1 FadR family transcriptional regulator [Prauserella endophytica]